MGKIKDKRISFKDSEGGSVALIIGICFISVIFGILALTIDLTKAQTGSNKTADAVAASAQGLSQYITQYQINNARENPGTNLNGNNKWQGVYPPSPEMQAVADQIFKQNLSLDQSYLTPVPIGN